MGTDNPVCLITRNGNVITNYCGSTGDRVLYAKSQRVPLHSIYQGMPDYRFRRPRVSDSSDELELAFLCTFMYIRVIIARPSKLSWNRLILKFQRILNQSRCSQSKWCLAVFNKTAGGDPELTFRRVTTGNFSVTNFHTLKNINS